MNDEVEFQSQNEADIDSKPINLSQGGFSLLELMIGMVIIAGLIALGSGMFGSALGRGDTTVERSNIANIMTSIRATRSGAGYPSEMHDAMMRIEGYPTTMDIDTDTDTVYNVWGGVVTIGATSATVNNARGYFITYTNVPEGACYDLATSVGTARNIWTTVAETDTWSNTMIRGTDLDLLETQANEDCLPSDDNAITWFIN